MDEKFKDFLLEVPTELQGFVMDLNNSLIEKGCKFELKAAKSGPVASYVRNDSDKKLLNFIFRKTGMKIRIYAANIAKYQELLDTFPDAMKKDIIKATDCKKLNGLTCSPTCSAGYTFCMDGIEYKKCRNMAFLISLNDNSNSYVMKMLDKETTI